MKKFYLLSAMALATVSAFAVTDGNTYEQKNGITCTNKWINSRISNPDGWNSMPFAEMPAKARTACLYTNAQGETKIIVGFSKTMTVDESSNDYAHLVVINIATGAVEKTVQMTCDGKPISGLLCANQVGSDDFGHLWFCSYLASTTNTSGEANTHRIYKVDDLDNGICSVACDLKLDVDEGGGAGRIDYTDLVGDITRQECSCSVMVALASGESEVIGWYAAQGEDTFGKLMNGGEYNVGVADATYPDGQTTWGTAPMVTIVRNEEHTADLFYLDGFTTCPSLYNNDCGMLESFASASDLAPKPGTNGVGEFSIGDKYFIAYSMEQYDSGATCRLRVCELGEGQAFEGMQEYWVLPANGLGEVSDGGTRVHSINCRKYPNGDKDGAYLITYKCNNGIAAYSIGEEGWVDPVAAGVNDVISDEDANAPVEYFNLQGVAVDSDNLTPGLYITRQGKTITKKMVR